MRRSIYTLGVVLVLVLSMTVQSVFLNPVFTYWPLLYLPLLILLISLPFTQNPAALAWTLIPAVWEIGNDTTFQTLPLVIALPLIAALAYWMYQRWWGSPNSIAIIALTITCSTLLLVAWVTGIAQETGQEFVQLHRADMLSQAGLLVAIHMILAIGGIKTLYPALRRNNR